jgi:hypothetical protein
VSESDTGLSPASKQTETHYNRSANVKRANHQANKYKTDIKQAKLAIRSIEYQTKKAGSKYFFKQWLETNKKHTTNETVREALYINKQIITASSANISSVKQASQQAKQVQFWASKSNVKQRRFYQASNHARKARKRA